MKMLLLLLLCIIGRTYYDGYTNYQRSDDAAYYTYIANPAPSYSGIIRVLHDNLMCSAVVISPTLALTAAHCAVGATRFMLQTRVSIASSENIDTGIKAKFIALDHEQDIALLKGDFSLFQTYPLSTTHSPKLGEHVLSCGFPHDAKLVCTDFEVIGNINFQLAVKGSSLQHGMSGGPVFNSKGEVIGVNSAVMYNNSVLSPTVGLEGLFNI